MSEYSKYSKSEHPTITNKKMDFSPSYSKSDSPRQQNPSS